MTRRHLDDDRAPRTGEASGPGRPDSPTYYDRPVLKEPVWIWSVPAYFHVGGVAAGSAMLAVVSQLVDREELGGLMRTSRDVAAVGGAVGTALLVHDLGRPERFLNMLRVFRPTSAMSVGSWTLAAASAATAGSALAPRVLPGTAGRVVGDVAGLAAGALAPVLGTYTGVLLADTAVPLWRQTRRELPVLFGAGALAAAASTLDLLPLDARSTAIVRRIGVGSKAADLAASVVVERTADRIERVGRPLHEGASGALWTAAKAFTGASLVLSLPPAPRRWRRVASGVLGTLGSLAMRFAVLQAGRASARDPRATFHQQRATRGDA